MRISDWSSDVCSSDLHGRGIAAVGADLDRAEAEIVLPPGLGRLVEDEPINAAGDALAIPFAILGALLERPPVEPVAVLNRQRAVVLLDAPLHPLEQRLDQLRVRRHHRLEIGVPGLQRSEEHTSELQSLMRISYA